jgi:hypothetical protein
VPVEGAAVGTVTGLSADGWVGSALHVELVPARGTESLELVGEAYGGLEEPLDVEVLVDGRPAGRAEGASGGFSVAVPLAATGGPVALEVRASAVRRPVDVGESGDERELAFRLVALRLHRAGGPARVARRLARALRPVRS